MFGRLLRILSPGGQRAAHQVLFFHRVLPQPDPLLPGDPDRAAFDALLGTLKRHCNILPLDQALAQMASGGLPRASLSISFDDGYADNASVALPVLQAHELSATFFVTTGYLDGGRMWNDTVIEALRRLPAGTLDLSELGLGSYPLSERVAERTGVVAELLRRIKHSPQRQQLADAIGARAGELPKDLMMSRAMVRSLADAGMGIGAHTLTHPILANLNDDQARLEMAGSKAELETLLQRPVTLFAYPNGKQGQDYDARHAQLAREVGFQAAFSTEPGVSRRGMDLWQLPRFTPWDKDHGRFLLRLLMNRYGLVR